MLESPFQCIDAFLAAATYGWIIYVPGVERRSIVKCWTEVFWLSRRSKRCVLTQNRTENSLTLFAWVCVPVFTNEMSYERFRRIRPSAPWRGTRHGLFGIWFGERNDEWRTSSAWCRFIVSTNAAYNDSLRSFFPLFVQHCISGAAEEKVDRLEVVKDFRSLRNVQLCSAQKATSCLTFWQNQRSRKDWSSLVGPKEGKKSWVTSRTADCLLRQPEVRTFAAVRGLQRMKEITNTINLLVSLTLCLLLIRVTCSHAGQLAELTVTFQRTVPIGWRMLDFLYLWLCPLLS